MRHARNWVCVLIAGAMLAILYSVPVQSAAATKQTRFGVVVLSTEMSSSAVQSAGGLLADFQSVGTLPSTARFDEQSTLSTAGFLYNPAPPDTPPCFVGSESGLPVLPVSESLITAAFRLAFEFGRPLWGHEYHTAIRTFEATICFNGNMPAGVVQDGFLADDEIQHLEFLNGMCFGNPLPLLTPDLLLAMSGKLPCPVPGANIMFGRVHIEQQVEVPTTTNVEIIKFVHADRGPVRVQETLDISRCEAGLRNLAQNPDADSGSWLFQFIPDHANPGNAIPNEGLVWSDMADPAYAAFVAYNIMTWFEKVMGAAYIPWEPSRHCHGHYY